MTVWLIVLVEYDYHVFTEVLDVCGTKESAEERATTYGIPFFYSDPDVAILEENEMRHILIEEWAVK